MDASSGIVQCPQCANNDQISKVSVVVRQGTASRPSEYWTGGAFPTRYPDVTARTDLARELALPSVPYYGSLPGKIIGTVIGCVVGIFILAAILGAVISSRAVASWLSVLVGLTAIVLIIGRLVANKRAVDAERQRWPALETAWYDLYFCARDDIVFSGTTPSRNAPARRANMMQLIAANG